MNGFIVVYVVVAVVWLFLMLGHWLEDSKLHNNKEEARLSARLVLATPVWPLAFVGLLVWGLGSVFTIMRRNMKNLAQDAFPRQGTVDNERRSNK